jgi:tetratricopeptide (TPR) repeat protein
MNVSSFKQINILVTMLLMAFLVGIGSTPVLAQDYKETFNAARDAAQAKDLKTALTKFSAAADGAKAAGDSDVERTARKIISQIEYNLGRASLKKEAFEEAIKHFDNGIANYPTNALNYLARASTLKKMDRTDDAIAAFAQTMEIAGAAQDSKTARQAEEAIRGHFIFLASSAISRNGARATPADGTEALGYIQEMLKYVDADADALYYTAVSQSAKGDYDAAVMSADQALEMHRGSRTDKAKIYFIKGEALMNQGDIPAAKEAFTNAAYGTYAASAKHYIETLGGTN